MKRKGYPVTGGIGVVFNGGPEDEGGGDSLRSYGPPWGE